MNDNFQELMQRLAERQAAAPTGITEAPDHGCCIAPGWVAETDPAGNTVYRPCATHKPGAYRAFMDGYDSLKSYWNGRAASKKAEDRSDEETKKRKDEWA